MSTTTTQEDRLARRVDDLTANDPQFAAAKPDPAVAAALEQPGLSLPQIIQTTLDGYADRPALGQRVVEFVKDPKTGRTSLELLPRYETITYGQLNDRVGVYRVGGETCHQLGRASSARGTGATRTTDSFRGYHSASTCGLPSVRAK